MVLDIDIAMFARNMTSYGQDKAKPPPKFKRPQVGVTPLSRQTPIDQIAKHLRHTAWKKHEQHTKQVQMLIDQRRFAQNATWQAEYDRLRGSNIMSPVDLLRIDGRIDDLLKAGLQIK